jgi:hypothetical protein
MTLDVIVGALAIAIIIGLLVYFRISSARHIRNYYASQGSNVAGEQDKYLQGDELRFLDDHEREIRDASRRNERDWDELL